MSVVWALLVAATSVSPVNANDNARAVGAVAAHPAAAASPYTDGYAPPATSVPVESAAPSAKQLRAAVAAGLRRANAAKPADRTAAVTDLIALFRKLGQDRQLPAHQRQRLGVEVRSRLLRFAAQFRHESARIRAAMAAGSQFGSAVKTADPVTAGARGGAEVEGLDNMVDLIQKTIGPQDWVLAQRIGGPGAAGQFGGGQFGGGQQGGAGQGGAFGGGLDQQTDANGKALVDLIQTTIAPDSWDIRGGPGSIVYFNRFRALVVRQSGEGQDNLADLLNGLRK